MSWGCGGGGGSELELELRLNWKKIEIKKSRGAMPWGGGFGCEWAIFAVTQHSQYDSYNF